MKQPKQNTPAEDKDLLILQLKKANLEFAAENMNLQGELLKIRYADVQRDLAKISAELEAKEKEKH